MKRHLVITLVLLLGLNVPFVLAYRCPKLVEECRALVTKLEKRRGVDQAKVAEAKEGCEEALRLHKAGQHKESVIKAGEAIAQAGHAVK
ncbi:MAG: hypothetical protein ACE5G5_11660 [Candidatus Methylomirabilales bacterium]